MPSKAHGNRAKVYSSWVKVEGKDMFKEVHVHVTATGAVVDRIGKKRKETKPALCVFLGRNDLVTEWILG